MSGYTTCMDTTPLPPEPYEPPLTSEEQAWLAGLLDDVGPEGAYTIAEYLGIDLDEQHLRTSGTMDSWEHPCGMWKRR